MGVYAKFSDKSVVDFGDRLAERWPVVIFDEQQVPALYDYCRQVYGRGRIHPREMYQSAKYFLRINQLYRVSKKIVLKVMAAARSDAKTGINCPPDIKNPCEHGTATAERLARLAKMRPPKPDRHAEWVTEMAARTEEEIADDKREHWDWLISQAQESKENAIQNNSDIEIARATLRELRRRYREVVCTEGAFWRYDRDRWAPIADNELRLVVQSFDGLWFPQFTDDDENDLAKWRHELGHPLHLISEPKPARGKVKLTKGRIDSILSAMVSMAEEPDFFADAAVGINACNGFITFDAAGKPTLQNHRSSHKARHTLPGSWVEGGELYWGDCLLDKIAITSYLSALLYGCFQDDDDIEAKTDLLAEVMGAVALGHSTKLMKPKAIVLHGPSAENGKSQVLNLLRGLVPPEAVASIPPARFSDASYICQLANKMVNCADELSSASAVSSDQFKSVVTGEPVAARDLYQSAMNFRPQALHCFATNILPSFAGGFDRGVQRRLAIIEFNRVVPEEERIEGIGQLIVTEEADLLLAFAVVGASRLIARRQYNEPESSRRALRAWIHAADPVQAWIEDQVEVVEAKPLPRVRKSIAYEHFRIWARREGFTEARLPAINHFCSRVVHSDSRIGEGRTKSEGRYFIGIEMPAPSAMATDKSANSIFD